MFTVRVRVRARVREWNYFCFFFFLCVKVTKTCVLLVAVQRSDVRLTLCDVMMMYSQDRYMKDLPIFLQNCKIRNRKLGFKVKVE